MKQRESGGRGETSIWRQHFQHMKGRPAPRAEIRWVVCDSVDQKMTGAERLICDMRGIPPGRTAPPPTTATDNK